MEIQAPCTSNGDGAPSSTFGPSQNCKRFPAKNHPLRTLDRYHGRSFLISFLLIWSCIFLLVVDCFSECFPNRFLLRIMVPAGWNWSRISANGNIFKRRSRDVGLSGNYHYLTSQQTLRSFLQVRRGKTIVPYSGHSWTYVKMVNQWAMTADEWLNTD